MAVEIHSCNEGWVDLEKENQKKLDLRQNKKDFFFNGNVKIFNHTKDLQFYSREAES